VLFSTTPDVIQNTTNDQDTSLLPLGVSAFTATEANGDQGGACINTVTLID